MTLFSNYQWQKTYVLFRNEQQMKFLRILKKNFRHCAVVFKSQDFYLHIDPTFFRIETRIFPKNADLLSFLQKEGWSILETPYLPSTPSSLRLNWIDCVSLTKRLLGIKKWGIFTPYQLYKYLTR
ncbi:MAG: hypothetical protein JXR30_03260 [Alphaproteobacteria bacterium]|nr:hypothetical protein [Alphaproteobacteria bacterium]